jgi:predicted HTH transcriptional regulator
VPHIDHIGRVSDLIDAGRFDSETVIKDSVTIRSDLFSEVEACMDFVRKHISKRFIISGKAQRDEAWEYPREQTDCIHIQRGGNN